jgi:hypothetical protein
MGKWSKSRRARLWAETDPFSTGHVSQVFVVSIGIITLRLSRGALMFSIDVDHGSRLERALHFVALRLTRAAVVGSEHCLCCTEESETAPPREVLVGAMHLGAELQGSLAQLRSEAPLPFCVACATAVHVRRCTMLSMLQDTSSIECPCVATLHAFDAAPSRLRLAELAHIGMAVGLAKEELNLCSSCRALYNAFPTNASRFGVS